MKNGINVEFPLKGTPEIRMLGKGEDQARVALMFERVRPFVEKALKRWIEMQAESALSISKPK